MPFFWGAEPLAFAFSVRRGPVFWEVLFSRGREGKEHAHSLLSGCQVTGEVSSSWKVSFGIGFETVVHLTGKQRAVCSSLEW